MSEYILGFQNQRNFLVFQRNRHSSSREILQLLLQKGVLNSGDLERIRLKGRMLRMFFGSREGKIRYATKQVVCLLSGR